MEKLQSVRQEKRSSPKSSKKKKPVKVVYISNPMKIKASPSEFRAVVQQYTGRYASSPPPHDQLAEIINKNNQKEEETAGGYGGGSDLAYNQSGCREDELIMDDDLIITPQMLLELGS